MLITFGFAEGCICVNPATCSSVIFNLKVAKKMITLNYKFMDKLMAIKMNAINNKEKQIKKQQQEVLELTTHIRKIQQAIAFEERKKKFLINRLKQLNIYKGIK